MASGSTAADRTGAASARSPGAASAPVPHGAPSRDVDSAQSGSAAAIGVTGAVDRTAAVARQRPGPFTPRQLARLDEALTMSSRETGIDFSVYVGALEEPTREHAERLHAGLGAKAPNAVLLAVSPGQRVLHIVTGAVSSRRLPDRAAALAALSMQASFAGGDLVGGIVNGLRMLSDQVGHPDPHRHY